MLGAAEGVEPRGAVAGGEPLGSDWETQETIVGCPFVPLPARNKQTSGV